MKRPGFADQQDLLRWADVLAARSEFPRLVRRLILETAASVEQLGFPAGEGIGTGGWDGTVRATQSTAFVPAGLSVWELSVEKSVRTKADRDYAKRKTTPDGSETKDCSYVPGSLRRWAKRGEWAREHSAKRRWREVRAYGVDDFETWLESAPVTHAWISDQLGLGPHGLRAAESWWQSWSGATTPVMPADVVLAGRSQSSDELLSRLAASPQVITVQAGSLQESLAFVVATAIRAANAGNGQIFARTALVDDIASWRSVADHASPLVLIPLKDAAAEAGSAPRHHVIVPVAAGADADIELPPIDAAGATDALKTAGLTGDRRADQPGAWHAEASWPCAVISRTSLNSTGQRGQHHPFRGPSEGYSLLGRGATHLTAIRRSSRRSLGSTTNLCGRLWRSWPLPTILSS